MLWHFPFSTLEEVLHKANLYSSLGAQAQANARVSMWSALGHGLWAFVRLYIFKRGFVDGWAGFIIALGLLAGWVPLLAVFAQALAKGVGAYVIAIADPNAWASVKLTLTVAAKLLARRNKLTRGK